MEAGLMKNKHSLLMEFAILDVFSEENGLLDDDRNIRMILKRNQMIFEKKRLPYGKDLGIGNLCWGVGTILISMG